MQYRGGQSDGWCTDISCDSGYLPFGQQPETSVTKIMYYYRREDKTVVFNWDDFCPRSQKLTPEASLILIVTDFTISVLSSSCNSLFLVSFSLIFFQCFFLVIRTCTLGRPLNTKRKQKEREWGIKADNYMNCCIIEILKSRTIRLPWELRQ